MRSFGSKTWVAPCPVLIIGTYDENGTPNAMNAAWGGTYDTNKVFVSLAKHKTTDNLEKTKAFTIGFADAKNVVACDYFGIATGNKVSNKIEVAKMTVTKAETVNAPVINELPMTLECSVESFEDGILIGKIENVVCRDEFVGEDGQPDISKMELITFDPVHFEYHVLGEKVGQGFSDGRQLL